MLTKIETFFKHYFCKNDGAVAAEFSFVVIPFILLVFGVMEAGRMGLAFNGVQYAIEETSRYAALNQDLSDAEFQTYAEDQLSSMFVRPASFNLSSSRITSGGVNFVQVSADYSHATMAGGLLGDFGNVNFSTYSRKPIVN